MKNMVINFLNLIYHNKKLLLALGLFLFSFSLAHAADPITAFQNVNVIPMDSERVLENQTVLVRDAQSLDIRGEP
jgi:hypothetical protein